MILPLRSLSVSGVSILTFEPSKERGKREKWRKWHGEETLQHPAIDPILPRLL